MEGNMQSGLRAASVVAGRQFDEKESILDMIYALGRFCGLEIDENLPLIEKYAMIMNEFGVGGKTPSINNKRKLNQDNNEIEAVNQDQTMHIVYDDGDEETDVSALFVRLCEQK
jgi:hypothetical protein